jgi:hypothetical protein
MKAIKKILVLAVVLISVAIVFGSCQKKACPAYSKVNTVQSQQNA